MTARVRFTQANLTRAIKACEKAGLSVAGAEVAPDGTIRIITGEGRIANNNGRRLLDKLHAA